MSSSPSSPDPTIIDSGPIRGSFTHHTEELMYQMANPPQYQPDPIEETVNHPPHYNQHPSGVECIDIVEHFNFNVGNAIKYMWRAGLKEGQIVDLKKAEWYIRREIARLESSHYQSDASTEEVQ